MEEEGSIERAIEAKRGSPFLNPKQAAHYRGVSLRTLQKHRTRGTGLRYRRPCRRIRYHIDYLDNWSIAQAEGTADV